LVGTTEVTAVLISYRAVTGLRAGQSGLESRQVQCLSYLQNVRTGSRTPHLVPLSCRTGRAAGEWG